MTPLSNTWLHLLVGLLAGMIVAFVDYILHSVPNTSFHFGLMYCVIWFLITLQLERWQKNSSNSPCYWKIKWADSVTDMLAGNIPFIVTLLLAGTFK